MRKVHFLAIILAVVFIPLSGHAGNLTKTFNKAANPPPPPSKVRKDFDAAKGSEFKYDYPAPHCTPAGGPCTRNGSSSVAVPLNPPFKSVGKLK